METKFTKAPWLVRENDFIGDKLDIWHNDYSGVEQIPVASVEIGLNPLFDAEQKANAHLIAAAPDLYAEHKEWAEKFGAAMMAVMQEDFQPIIDLAMHMPFDFHDSGEPTLRSQALAKARGEQP